MVKGFFIVGTDTGVGKTVVTAGIARALPLQGCSVRVCKPVATGAEWDGSRLIAEDTRLLAAAAEETDLDAVTPWVFAEPLAPAVAARLNGTPLRLEQIAAAVRRRAYPDNLVLVEGVGGLLCPLTETETIADLAALLSLPLVIVVRNALGALNQTLLTLEVAQRRGLAVAGLIVNHPDTVGNQATATNVEELNRRIAVPLLGVVPFQPEVMTAEVPALTAVDWLRLGEKDTKQPCHKR